MHNLFYNIIQLRFIIIFFMVVFTISCGNEDETTTKDIVDQPIDEARDLIKDPISEAKEKSSKILKLVIIS